MCDNLTEAEYINQYDPGKYERPSTAADAIVFGYADGCLQILLVQRKKHPYRGWWVYPGGFIELNENPDNAVRRELEEETGVRVGKMTQLGAFGAPDRDPRYHVISIAYFGVVRPEKARPRAGDDAAYAAWHPVRKAPPLAFDHEKVLKIAHTRLKEEMRRPSFARRFLRRRFTGADLHALYEEVLGIRIDMRRFLRRLAPACRLAPKADEPVQLDPAALRRFEAGLGVWWLQKSDPPPLFPSQISDAS